VGVYSSFHLGMSETVWVKCRILQETFINYFKDIFSSTSTGNPQELMYAIQNRVTPEMKKALEADFTTEEVHQAINHIVNNYILNIGKDCHQYILNIVSKNGDPSNINQTFICLIPKNNNLSTPNDYRLISL